MNPNQETLFPRDHKARYGENRLQRSLFLPKLLKIDSADTRLEDETQKQAFKIIEKWANLEESGKLAKKNETALEGEFLTDVFGKALGYTLFSENLREWNLNPKYSINGGIADAAIGLFNNDTPATPLAVIELKGPQTNLDRDRFNGRTAIQQCWDYMNALPGCQWGIVSNYVSIRLYHRSVSSKIYQLFVLQELRELSVFRQFYYVMEKGGLLPSPDREIPRAVNLLRKTDERQREVGDELYNEYDRKRYDLIVHLIGKRHKRAVDKAIRIAQKILDRIIFIAFCEDRDLLPADSILKAYNRVAAYHEMTNPRWQNFLHLFSKIDKGDRALGISPYDGGLFRVDDDIDKLNLDDEWTGFFNSIGEYDFRHEIDVDILGHIFERSINDVEVIRRGGFFEPGPVDDSTPKMLKSAERKKFGIFYTPPEFTSLIVANTVTRIIDDRFEALAHQYGGKRTDFETGEPAPHKAKYWKGCLEILQNLRIVDPACGSGAFLIAAYEALDDKYNYVTGYLSHHGGTNVPDPLEDIPDIIVKNNLYGVDLSKEAVEITQLSLWLRTARKGRSLADLSQNIVQGNSLVSDRNVHPLALDWENVFPGVFKKENPGFDCVIGNPPWERIKLQEREFFDAGAPEIASTVNAAKRRQLIDKLKKTDPGLYDRYLTARNDADATLSYIRASGVYPLTGQGDINTYAVFAELANNLVSSEGRVGLLVPSGIATDHTTKEIFEELLNSKRLSGLFDFENRQKIFPDVDGRFKFCVLLFGGTQMTTSNVDFVFFAHHMEDLQDKTRHIKLSPADIELFNPNTKTCPIFRSPRDAALTKVIYQRVPILVDERRKSGGNPWGIRFFTMFHQTNDAELFKTAEDLKSAKFKLHGSRWKKGKTEFLPLYEAKMIQMYDHRAASVVIEEKNWMRQGQTEETVQVQHQNPEFTVIPRWWVQKEEILKRLLDVEIPGFICIKDVTSATNRRTMIAAYLPLVGTLNSAPIIFTGQDIAPRRLLCMLANLNSLPLDFIARQKVGGVHLNFFIVEQLPIFNPDFYAERCPWDKRQTLEKWISDRVLKLTCTNEEMRPLAEAAGFDPPIHKWNPRDRVNLSAELDAAYFLLYGITRDDVEYILSTFSGVGKTDKDLFEAAGVVPQILKHYDALRQKSA
jgi:hypothetical protein